ncbi:MAG: UDP-3-O-(3-hydroxymyristoyl)glucosamine N-acyltransferase [Chitinophagales bacterium]|nr:UDP-3-O-(3-hydroxymyristoyl)glucosamine N-acyltransferase [Bacteroidota bacterium]
MKLPTPITVQEIADLVGAKIIGDAQATISGINEIHKVEVGDLSFVDHPKYYTKSLSSAASVILINTEEVANPQNKILLYHNDPFSAYNFLTQHFSPFAFAAETIAPNSDIHPTAQLFPNVFIGNKVRIGKNTIIYPNVCIYDHSEIGDNVIIHANTTIGSDAFYYKKRATQYEKMHSCGKVIIENEVEIGASCTIDRGVSGETRIGFGSKIDNMVHIGHGVVLGKNCLIAAQVGIAGKTTLGDNVTVWGQVGINKSLHVGSNSIILGKSGIPKSLPEGKTWFGVPVQEAGETMRQLAAVKHLPEMLREWSKQQKEEGKKDKP